MVITPGDIAGTARRLGTNTSAPTAVLSMKMGRVSAPK